jgi:hypothetical protein
MMDDIEIAELFVRNLDSNHPRQKLTLDGIGEAYTLATRFQEIDPKVAVLVPDSKSTLNWSTLVAQGQEQWPIAFLMPSGAALKAKSR